MKLAIGFLCFALMVSFIVSRFRVLVMGLYNFGSSKDWLGVKLRTALNQNLGSSAIS